MNELIKSKLLHIMVTYGVALQYGDVVLRPEDFKQIPETGEGDEKILGNELSICMVDDIGLLLDESPEIMRIARADRTKPPVLWNLPRNKFPVNPHNTSKAAIKSRSIRQRQKRGR